jgi:glutathione S-transferase
LRVLDLFCGSGGISQGFQSAGFEIAGGIDFDFDSVETFKRNFPKANLLPSYPWLELKAISILSWCSSGIHPFLARINSPAKVCGFPGSEESIRDIAAQQLMENFHIADGMLAGREYLFDHFTAPDAHFYWCYRRATQFNLDLSGFKNCNAHFVRMESRKSVQKLLAYEKDVQQSFAASS